MQLTTPPPEKLSDLIDIAIADAHRLDHAAYTPAWSTWHEPRPVDGKCAVCLAGAVIAGTLGCPAGTAIRMSELSSITDERWRRALLALDSAREGHWAQALSTLRKTTVDYSVRIDLHRIPPPDKFMFNGWDHFDSHLTSLATRAKQLRKLGL